MEVSNCWLLTNLRPHIHVQVTWGPMAGSKQLLWCDKYQLISTAPFYLSCHICWDIDFTFILSATSGINSEDTIYLKTRNSAIICNCYFVVLHFYYHVALSVISKWYYEIIFGHFKTIVCVPYVFLYRCMTRYFKIHLSATWYNLSGLNAGRNDPSYMTIELTTQTIPMAYAIISVVWI